MRRVRRPLPSNPKQLSELGKLPERFRKFPLNKKFLIFDSRPDSEEEEKEDHDDRVLVHASRRHLEFLYRSPVCVKKNTIM